MAQSLFQRWWNKRELYRRIFRDGRRDPKLVRDLLDDLREFCRADQSCVIVAKNGCIDTHATLLAEGRREVFLHIQETLNLTDEALNRMKEMEES